MGSRIVNFGGILLGLILCAVIVDLTMVPKGAPSQPEEQRVAKARQEDRAEIPPEDRIEAQRPPDQAALVEIISRSINEALHAKNSIEEDRVNKKNDQAYCEALNKVSVMKNWTGRIAPVGINSNGAIEIGADIGALYDLVPVDSPLYEKIAKLSDGQPVVFSGKFNWKRDGDVADMACDPGFDSSNGVHQYNVVLTDIQAL